MSWFDADFASLSRGLVPCCLCISSDEIRSKCYLFFMPIEVNAVRICVLVKYYVMFKYAAYKLPMCPKVEGRMFATLQK